MDTPRTPRDNLRTSPGLEDLEELEAPLLPALAGALPGGEEALLPPADEGKRILAIGAPLVLEEVAVYLSTVISLGFAGRLGSFALSAFTLSHALTNITGIALLNGVTCSIDTYGSQAHGSRAFAAVGATLQKGLVLSLLTCVPLMGLYWAAGPLLLLLGQERQLAAAAARYTWLYSGRIPLHAVALCCYRTLASQGAAGHVLAAGALFAAATAPVNWLLVNRLGWGLDGSALAAVACEALYAAALVAACAAHNARRPPGERWWQGWSGAAMLADWGPFLRLSAAATLMIVLDWWVYDVLTFLAGWLPDPDVPVAASGIAYYVQSLIFMVPLGLSFASCARVGHHLGAGRPRGAKLSAEVGTSMGMVAVGLSALAIVLAPRRIARLFARDPAVVEACVGLMPAMALMVVTNGATALLSGVLRGSGRQRAGAVANGLCMYGVGLPLQLLLMRRYAVNGLWWGLSVAAALQAALLAALVSRFDWRHEAARAAKLVRHLSQASLSASRSSSRRRVGAAEGQPGGSLSTSPEPPSPPLLPPSP